MLQWLRLFYDLPFMILYMAIFLVCAFFAWLGGWARVGMAWAHVQTIKMKEGV